MHHFSGFATKILLPTIVLFSVALFSVAQDITEYEVPGTPRGITVGPDGALWIAENNNTGAIGRMTRDESLSEYPTIGAPELITAGPDGALWFTQAYNNLIGRITTTGVITEYLLPHSSYYGESYPLGIVSGPDGALWFTEAFGNRIGRITTSGIITEYTLPQADSNPDMITVGPDGGLWFTENSGIGRISTSGVITEYPVSSPRGTGITSGPDGRLWFVRGDRIGSITTDGIVSEYMVRTAPPTLGLFGITAGPDRALWFTEADGNKIGRITTAGQVTEYPVPTPDSFPLEITLGPDGALWFTEAVGKIGRIVLPDTTPPQITISVSPKALWPPNGKMKEVAIWGTMQDTESGIAPSSVKYAVIDEYGQIHPTGHMALDAAGNYSFTVLLQASREDGDTDGRQYSIRVSARDNAGNRAVEWNDVIVPHDRR